MSANTQLKSLLASRDLFDLEYALTKAGPNSIQNLSEQERKKLLNIPLEGARAVESTMLLFQCLIEHSTNDGGVIEGDDLLSHLAPALQLQREILNQSTYLISLLTGEVES